MTAPSATGIFPRVCTCRYHAAEASAEAFRVCSDEANQCPSCDARFLVDEAAGTRVSCAFALLTTTGVMALLR